MPEELSKQVNMLRRLFRQSLEAHRQLERLWLALDIRHVVSRNMQMWMHVEECGTVL